MKKLKVYKEPIRKKNWLKLSGEQRIMFQVIIGRLARRLIKPKESLTFNLFRTKFIFRRVK